MSKKIKVAYLDYSEVFAGAEQVLHAMISHINRSKIEPVLVFPYPKDHQERYSDLGCEKYCLADGIKWWMGHYRWVHPMRGTDMLARTIWGVKLALLLMKLDIDILHVNLLRPDSLMWLLPCKKMGIKVIGHFRSQKKEWVPLPIVQKQCDLVLCVSNYSRSRFLWRGEFTKSQTLYDCINIKKFSGTSTDKCALLKKLGFSEDTMLISSVGQLSSQKGHDNAIKAFVKVADRYPLAKLYIAGSGVELRNLENLIAIFSQYANRIIMSKKQVSNVNEVYGASAVVLSLTNVGEAFGLVPYEAALCGTPCIAPEFGAIIEFLEDKKSGLLVDTRNVDAVAEKLCWALSHEDECKQITVEANKIIDNCLTPYRLSKELVEVYASIIN